MLLNPVCQTKYECTVPSVECVQHLILQSIAVVNDASELAVTTTTTTNGGSANVSVTATSSNRFTKVDQTSKGVGLCGGVRLLCRGGSSSSDLFTPQDESWIQSAELALVEAPGKAAGGAGADVFAAAAADFADQLDKHLQGDQSYLTGAHVSSSDVAVALLVANKKGLQLPAKVRTWCATVLDQLHGMMQYQNIPGWITHGLLVQDRLGDSIQQLGGAPAAPASAAKSAPATGSTIPAATTGSTIPAGENAIIDKLNELGVTHQVYDHTLCKTAEELVANVPLPTNESHTKNLFLKDKKHGLFLVTVRPDAHVNTKELGKQCGLTGKINLRMADASVLEEVLHAKPGCVGPLCMGIKTGDVTFVLDQDLLTKFDQIHSHPLQNDKSVKMTPADLQAYFSKTGVEPVKLEFGKVGDAPAPAAKGDTKPAAAASKDKGGSANKKSGGKKGETLLALQWKKHENFPAWYSDVIVLSEMISYYDISGCYILRPWSYKMWEMVQEWFNGKIQEMGVENAYFPLFVSQDRLEKEKDHVEGFAPEVAWVTKSGDGDLAKPIAIRPTSETVMYPAYSDWIRSHRDLPLKLNQWSNVVRWEFKYPTPFLRTREFLWQEGHTAHATYEEAQVMVRAALELYRAIYEDLMAVPVVPGYKTEKEKFAGGYQTTTVEAYIAGSGRAIQGATSHNLGQNFGKMFDISFQDESGKSQIPWQTSWGLTTRTLGVMVMVHGDDVGLVLPPRMCPLQVVIVPILSKKGLSVETASPYCLEILKNLKSVGIRAKYDDRDLYNPGWKYNHWEQKGVCVRLEVGPRDVEQKSVRCVIRHNGEKKDVAVDGIGQTCVKMLDEIQDSMFAKAKEARDSHLVQVTEWKDFVPNLEKNNLVLTPWCGGEHQDWEEKVKEMSRAESLAARGETVEDEKTATSVAAKTLCIPFDQPELPEGTKCFASGLDATCWVLWGRSY